MTNPTSSAEASLLFGTSPARDIGGVVPELTRCLDSLGWPPETVDLVPGEHLVLHCGTVQVLIAHCRVAHETVQFEGAVRPGTDPGRDALALIRLEAHQESIVVLVSDRPGAAREESLHAKQAICWDVADLVSESLGAELVFWNATDTLYFSDEFAEESLGGARDLPARFAEAPPAAMPAAVPARELAGPPVPVAEAGMGFLDPLREDRAPVPAWSERIRAAEAGVPEADVLELAPGGVAAETAPRPGFSRMFLIGALGLAISAGSLAMGRLPLP